MRRLAAVAVIAVALALLPPARSEGSAPLAGPTPTPPSAAVAGGFLIYKFVLGTPGCTGVGLNISANPYFARNDCGFGEFTISGAGADPVVTVAFVGPDGAPFLTQSAAEDDGSWQFDIVPTGAWPAGEIGVVVRVDGATAGRSMFFHNTLGADVAVEPKVDGTDYEPGEAVPVDITMYQADTSGNALDKREAPARGTLVLATPTGSVITITAFTAAMDGTFATTVPGSATVGMEAGEATNFLLTLSLRVVNASHTDGTTGEWAASLAGTAQLVLLDPPSTLLVRNSYVSSTGWVKPGEGYPFRVFVRNFTDQAATGVVVTIPAPDGVTLDRATPLTGGGSAAITSGSITWSVDDVPAANNAGPQVRTLVVQATAAASNEDPEIVWKDLSSVATLTYTGYAGPPLTSMSHGPKVVPSFGGFETARYGDKPFPIVPVDYTDRGHQEVNTGDRLSTVVNDSGYPGSTFNLYQEMSYRQLYPNGVVPSAGIATADFEYDAGFDFTTPPTTEATPEGKECRGTTFGSLEAAIGTPLYPERIVGGWYRLPGNTEYYGGDSPAFTAMPSGIDSACGPLGKAVYDAAQIADPEIDYNAFDSDKDGVVDFFMLLFVGCGGNGASQLGAAGCPFHPEPYDNIWPHSSSLEQQYKDENGLRGYVSDDQLKSATEVPQCWLDARRLQSTDCASAGGTGNDTLPVLVRVGPYNVNPETSFETNSVISHEYGHHLGLPDYYSTSFAAYGSWNLMASDHAQHMTVFSKQELGWVVPVPVEPGQTVSVDDWPEIKEDIGQIHWKTPEGTPYTLSAANGDQNVHNGFGVAAKLPRKRLIDPEKVATQASPIHVWHSGQGNDFGCSPSGAHNLDVALPELAAVPHGTPVTLTFKSSWDIEWDFDYGFVLVTTDGAEYTSLPSENGYTTDNSFNPSGIQCQEELDNGLTGTSGAHGQGPAMATAARLSNDYTDGSPFLTDQYDLSDLAGADNAVLRFSYSTDGAFARPGWFIDDIRVTAGSEVIYESGFEAGVEQGRLFPGGCDADGIPVAATCTAGWNRVRSDVASPLDHAYYLELRDRAGFDFEGHGQSDRGVVSWAPGLLIEYTDEARGYGNVGIPQPPAQHYIDSQAVPGVDCNNDQDAQLANDSVCDDAAFTDALGDTRFRDVGWIDNFDDPDSADEHWHFDHNCLTVEVLSMVGEDTQGETLPADLSADVVVTGGPGCAPFEYGHVLPAAPDALATGLSRTFFFAEGTTLPGFEEYLLLFNPQAETVTGSVGYALEGGTTPGPQEFSIAPLSRLTLSVAEAPGVGRGQVGVGAVVEASAPVAAERAMYFDASIAGMAVDGAHAVTGVSAPRSEWLFAEGSTQPGFREYLTLVNPGTTDATADITYGVEGAGQQSHQVDVPAGRRVTVDPSSVIGAVVGHSTSVSSRVPILVERPVYFDATVAGLPVAGGHVAFGAAAANDLAFAEGNVLPDFREFVTLANPAASAASVTLTYLLENKPPETRTVTVDGGSRRTVQVFDAADPGGIGTEVSDPVTQGVSLLVHTDAPGGIVAERPMYFARPFPRFSGPVSDGHTSPGAPGLARSWAFAEGTTLPAFDTFITVQNPGAHQSAAITYFTDTPSDGPITRVVTLPAGSRTTIQMFGPPEAGGLGLERTGVAFTVTAAEPILVERPLYVLGAVGALPDLDGGTNVVGFPI